MLSVSIMVLTLFEQRYVKEMAVCDLPVPYYLCRPICKTSTFTLIYVPSFEKLAEGKSEVTFY